MKDVRIEMPVFQTDKEFDAYMKELYRECGLDFEAEIACAAMAMDVPVETFKRYIRSVLDRTCALTP